LIIDISEDGKFAAVSAFSTPHGLDPSAALRDLRAAIPRAELQFFDATCVAGTEHLEIAAVNALRAIKVGTNISRSLAVETLLYASAQRQIDVAIEMLGVTQNSKTVGFVAFSESQLAAEDVEARIAQFVGADLDETLLDRWSEEKVAEITTIYRITPKELEAIRMPGQKKTDVITKAVIERVALLSTRT
jgi:tRNA threonylcarbamoyladenosine modification (KEOPS) complex Cgi121 subunit